MNKKGVVRRSQNMKSEYKINLFDHYRKLLFYLFHRFEGENYRLMKEYLAQILITEVEEYMTLWHKKVLDVGGARGEFCKIINEKRKCDSINLEPHPRKDSWPITRIGFADNIPFDNNEFDLVICRGVLEHIPTEKQQKSVNELYRVTKVGGICYILIPPWYSLHAGHNLKPFHLFPFKMAKFLRQLVVRNKIKANSFEELGLYSITFKRMSKMISSSNFKVLTTKDTHFRLHFLTKIPIIREIMVPAVAFILIKNKEE